MKSLFTILLLLFFGKSFSQKNIVVIQRSCFDSCTKTKKIQYAFNSKGQIKEYLIFGDYHNPDTNYVANISKFKYEKLKVLERINYTGKYLDSKVVYIYKDGRLSTVEYKNSSTKYFYNNKNKVSYNLMLEGLDTVRTVKYSYKNNELVEIFRYTNKIENEKTVYSKSNDTIIETLTRHDSINNDRPWKLITKKKFDGPNIVYYYCFYEDDKSSVENTISYDSLDNIVEINQKSNEENSTKKEKSEFNYKNGFIHKIEEFEFVDNSWKQKYVINFDIHKSNVEPNEKLKKQINLYLIQQRLTFL